MNFIFNIVNSNAKAKWQGGDNYLYLDKDETKYYFSSVHDKEMSEKFISEEEINNDIKLSNWEIVYKITPSGNSLDSKYSWYVLKHN